MTQEACGLLANPGVPDSRRVVARVDDWKAAEEVLPSGPQPGMKQLQPVEACSILVGVLVLYLVEKGHELPGDLDGWLLHEA
jgi:hypothetical protein